MQEQQPSDMTLLTHPLVSVLRRYVQDDHILHAFQTIARHEFIPSYYTRDGQKWQRVPVSDPTWLEEIYKDRPLTTSLDTYGNPNVSSSQPNLMALMMESVHVQPGFRVLEIGTGTGYNAALLASIVGAEHVVTLDIHKVLLDEARKRVEKAVGLGVTFLHVDGRHLPGDLGFFDAIIVTAAHDRVEPSWINVLAQSGRIVFNLQLGTFCKVMIEAEKTENHLIGRVCSYRGDFMPLHDGNVNKNEHVSFPRLGLLDIAEFRPLIEDSDLLFFLHIQLPGMVLTRYRNTLGERSYTLSYEQKIVLFAPFKIRGDRQLWEKIQAVTQTFGRLENPKRSAYSLTVDEDGSLTFFYKNVCLPVL